MCWALAECVSLQVLSIETRRVVSEGVAGVRCLLDPIQSCHTLTHLDLAAIFRREISIKYIRTTTEKLNSCRFWWDCPSYLFPVFQERFWRYFRFFGCYFLEKWRRESKHYCKDSPAYGPLLLVIMIQQFLFAASICICSSSWLFSFLSYTFQINQKQFLSNKIDQSQPRTHQSQGNPRHIFIYQSVNHVQKWHVIFTLFESSSRWMTAQRGLAAYKSR